jgi:hypothetical protein
VRNFIFVFLLEKFDLPQTERLNWGRATAFLERKAGCPDGQRALIRVITSFGVEVNEKDTVVPQGMPASNPGQGGPE